jgi:hypothetical protein
LLPPVAAAPAWGANELLAAATPAGLALIFSGQLLQMKTQKRSGAVMFWCHFA